jgi:hypothetical protein
MFSKKRRDAAAVVLIALFLAAPAFSQSTYATVSGTIEDASRALLPGVTVTATNNATGVVATVVSNESGAYNFPSLLPGVYKVSAELPGFQTRTYTDVQLGNAERVRLNFTLSVGGVNTAVEVTVAADTLLATSSSSVGEVLSEQKVQDMPLVGNNVLDLLRLLPGARMNADGVNGTFAGVDASKVNIQRDGVDASGSAYWVQAGAQSATFINPDLVGEMRMILAPVDAEFGRGNAQVQFLTRSGTNQFRGSAVWSARNTALDANTWNNNNDIDPQTGAWKPTKPNWVNAHQYTGSFGGPIVRNKTFFFALWDGVIVNARTTQNPVVLTPCARNGIFRYFDGWNNGNAIQPVQATGNTPTIAVVDGVGNPVRPATNPSGTPFTGQLRYASVFGRLLNEPTRPDCSDAQVQSGTSWDAFRTRQDPTGFVGKVLSTMPGPNNYEVGDGLNTAGYRWTRQERGGSEGIFAFGGSLARKQINTKIDHNFNTAHKLGVSYTYERSSGNSTGFETLPDGFRGRVERRPQTLSSNFTSTLSPTLVNEARLGYRRTAGKSYNALNNPETSQEALAFYPSFNGYPVVVAPGVGQTNFGNYPGSNSSSSYFDTTTLWTYADSLSWTKGKHAFKAGAEIRRGHSIGYDAGIGITTISRATGGDAPLAAIPAGAIGSANMPGLAGATTTGNNVRMRNLLSFLAGSLGSVTQLRFMQDPKKLDAFEDYKTFPQRLRDMHNQNETAVFFKDDWKAHTNLTLNLGMRWAYFSVPYESHGLMPLPVGGGNGIWGYSGRSWDGWMQPGQRGDLMTIEFVGKNSPNPGKTWYPNDYNNFGPAVGFAWQVPWLGDGKTTIRGGYQMTYQLNQSGNNIIQEINVPGASDGVTYIPSSADPYLDLTKLPSLVPVPSTLKPLQPVPVTARISQIYVPDSGLETPYAQNLTLSVTRSVRSNLTVDVRYIGTLARKQWNPQVNINQPNFLYNGLKEAFDAARAGDDSSPSLQVMENMFRGINVAGTGYGPVGSTVNGVLQTAGMHLRASTGTTGGVAGNLRTNLANGNYANVAAIINTLNYATAFNRGLPVIPAGVQGAVLRHNAFPENFIRANPQLGAAAYLLTTLYSNNYHSAEAQVTLRPTHGINLQSTYTWSKNLGVGQAGGLGATYTTMADRHADYSVQSDTRIHDFRTNGTFELPIGPNKLLAGSSSGALARAIEGWQLGWIVNVNSGQPMSIAAQNMLYALGTADIVGSFDTNAGRVQFQGTQTGSYLTPGAFTTVNDPQCTRVTALQGLQGQCTIDAIADARTGQILLQNPLPGDRGTLGQRILEGPGQWRFDANLRKSIRISETKSLEFRMDARNVLNHPEPADPILDINNANFGQIVGAQGNAKSTLHREFQAQLRFNF